MANVNFKYNEPNDNEPVRIEQVFAEKPAGGVIVAPGFDAPATTAVGLDSNGKFKLIKAYKLVAANGSADTSIKIAKGSGIVSGDIIAYGKKGVASTVVDTTNAEYDEVTVTMGVSIAKDEVLYEAAAASSSSATPKYTPLYVTGNDIIGGEGDKAVRLINGANLRKETANIGKDIAALMPTITLV